jgi:hypothetical protein
MSDQDERPITSRYHRRNLLRRRQEEGGLEAELRHLYNDDDDGNGNENEPAVDVGAEAQSETTTIEESQWQQNINDICAVVISRLERLHTRVAVLESKETSHRLDQLKRTYQMKKYETILLENDIADLKKRHLENMNLNLMHQNTT